MKVAFETRKVFWIFGLNMIRQDQTILHFFSIFLIAVSGANIWNSLHEQLKIIDSLGTFKSELRKAIVIDT